MSDELTPRKQMHDGFAGDGPIRQLIRDMRGKDKRPMATLTREQIERVWCVFDGQTGKTTEQLRIIFDMALRTVSPPPRQDQEVGEMVKMLEGRAAFNEEHVGDEYDLHHAAIDRKAAALISRLSAAREAVLAEVAAIFLEKAAVYAKDAKWIGPERQRYEGARVAGVEMSPMNGPALAYDAEMANVARIRALKNV